VFQHYAAFKHLSVYRNVAFGLEIRKRPKDEIRARVDELLALVHLEQFADRLPAQLSGGQRQRMALARALAVEPAVMLLDEPFGALDAQVRRELRDWLRRLHDEVHVTTVFVTHDQEEAMDVADEIVVINHGRIEQVGSPDRLYDAPANDFVMGFLGPVTRLGGVQHRPHDLEILPSPEPGAVAAHVVRVVRLGFEVRVDAVADDPGPGSGQPGPSGPGSGQPGPSGPGSGQNEVWVQVTRAQAAHLRLEAGTAIWLRPVLAPASTAGAR
jgi:sulfate transport system ATP-binding protein